MLGVTPPAPSLSLHLCVQTHTLHNARNNDFLGFPGLQTRGRPASPVACVRASPAAGGAAAPPTHLPTYLPTFNRACLWLRPCDFAGLGRGGSQVWI